VGHDQCRPLVQAREHRPYPVGLGGERVVGVFRSGRAADAQRLDHHRAVARRRKQVEQMPVAEGGAEQSRHQDDRLSGTGNGDAEGFGSRDGYQELLHNCPPIGLLSGCQGEGEEHESEQGT
jgi:hypothetical protein